MIILGIIFDDIHSSFSHYIASSFLTLLQMFSTLDEYVVVYHITLSLREIGVTLTRSQTAPDIAFRQSTKIQVKKCCSLEHLCVCSFLSFINPF